MRKTLFALAVAAFAAVHAQYSNQATQKWTQMRLAELEARLRVEIQTLAATPSDATPEEVTNSVDRTVSVTGAEGSATIGAIYNALSVTPPQSVVTQYMVLAASPQLQSMAGLTNALPVGATFTRSTSYPSGMAYYTEDNLAELIIYSSGTNGILTVTANGGSERFDMNTEQNTWFEMYMIPAARYTIVQAIIPR